MMFLIFVTILLIGMIWGGLGYSGGALLFAILLVIGGWAVIFFWAGSKSPNADPKQNHTSHDSAKSTRPASFSRPASSTRSEDSGHAAASDAYIAAGVYAGIYSENGRIGDSDADNKWDNSDEAGGLPRSVSPFSDIDDPYDRMILEEDMFHEDFETLSGGNPYDGDSYGGGFDGGFGDGFGDGFSGWFGEDD